MKEKQPKDLPGITVDDTSNPNRAGVDEGINAGKRKSGKMRKPGTKTVSFGSSGRENHDSSKFYDSKLYENIKVQIEKKVQFVENPVPPENIDRIFHKSSESMSELPNCSVHLMVTSPPYNVSKDYDDDLSLDEYRRMLKAVFRETYRVLVTGGRACINIANVGRKPYVPLHSYIIEDMLEIGFLMRGEIIWNKSASAGGSTAWGSWMSPSNPCLRDVHEYILIFCKESFGRKLPEGIKPGSAALRNSDSLQPGSAVLQNGGPLQPGSAALRNNDPLEPGSAALRNGDSLQPGSTALRNSDSLQPGSAVLQNSGPLQPGSAALRNGDSLQPGSTALRNSDSLQPGSAVLQNGDSLQPGSAVLQNGDPHLLKGNTSSVITPSSSLSSAAGASEAGDIINKNHNKGNNPPLESDNTNITPRNKTIQRDEFLEWTKSVWEFPTVSARKIGHPAPFPEELPHRLIQLYTYSGEVVLDPFCGSGSTCVAAVKDDRHFIGYDINDEYVKLAESRIYEKSCQKNE